MEVNAHLTVRRYNPEVSDEPWWQTFELRAQDTESVLDLLHRAKWYHDGTLALRSACGEGTCGADAMLINGRNRLACTAILADLGTDVVVEPLPGLPVRKDLIVDLEPFFEGVRSVRPWLESSAPGPRSERLQSPRARARLDAATRCTLCAACTSSCPIFWADDTYVGPAALVQAHRFVSDDRDGTRAERLERLSQRTGVFRCRTVFNCTDVCPEGIPVTELIQELKRAILDEAL